MSESSVGTSSTAAPTADAPPSADDASGGAPALAANGVGRTKKQKKMKESVAGRVAAARSVFEGQDGHVPRLPEKSIFESEPSRSTAAVRHGCTSEELQASAGVYESTPLPSRASVRHPEVVARGSTAEAMQEIMAATEVWQDTNSAAQTVFESRPGQRIAEVAHDDTVQVQSVGPSVWESKPQPGLAFASSFSRLPPAQEAESASVFESAPAPSSADVSHGRTGGLSDAALAEIQAAAEAAVEEELPAQATPVICLAEEARAVIYDSAEAHAESDVAFTFESQPVPSKAAARHGEAVNSDEYEYETASEDEDEEDRHRAAPSAALANAP